MKGFKVIFRKEEVDIVPDLFDAGIMISSRNGNYYIAVSGIHENADADLMSSVWIDSAMDIGESIQIDVMDLNEGSRPLSTHKAFSNETKLTPPEIRDMLDEQLETFYVLENLLKKEGIL